MSKTRAWLPTTSCRHRRGRALVGSTVALALVAVATGLLGASAAPAASDTAVVTPAAETTPAVASPYVLTPPSRGAYLGVFRPPAPYTPKTISDYGKLAGKPASMVMWYQPWSAKGANKFDAAMCVSVWKRGAIPCIVWEPWSPGAKPHNLKKPADMPEWRVSNITNGMYDAYITSFARDVKAAGGPVMISLFHEMNGRWYPWCGSVNGNSPAAVIAAWRHVHDIFVREGATNVTWVWSVNFQSYPNTYQNRYAVYYPGDAYVDWVAVSGFNWGQGVGGGPWKSFETIYRLPLRYLRTTHKPVLISEFASVENGGHKSAWLTDAFRRIRCAHPYVKALFYYDAREKSHSHVQDWRVNSSKKSLAAYRKAVRLKYFVGAAPSALARWRQDLTADTWAALLAKKRIY